MKKKILFLIIGSLYYIGNAYGQDSLNAPALWITGYGSIYYKYNFNKNATDNKTSFTNSQNSFELDMLSVKLQHAFGKVSFTGEIGIGKRAQEFSYNDNGISSAIQQLFISYTPIKWLTLTAGSFATYIGYESEEATANRNFSMSYLFTYGPFFHTGIKAQATAGSSTFMIGIFNPSDFKYAPPNSKKYIGAQWGFTPKGSPFTSYLNYLGGVDTEGVRTDQADIVMTYQFSKHFNIAYDGSLCHYSGNDPGTCWWGSALYFNTDITSAFGLTLRTEYFNDKDNLKVFTDIQKFPEGGDIWSFTLSGNYKIKALTLIPEVRLDHASEPLFTKTGSGMRNSPNVLLAAVYTF